MRILLHLREREHKPRLRPLHIWSRRLGGVWTLLSLARFTPRFLRDPAYRFVARNRYSWFGRSDTCRVPTAVEKARFLA